MTGPVLESGDDGEMSWKNATFPVYQGAGESIMVEMCPTVAPKPKKRTCNMHEDCDEADAKVRARGVFTDHCHDDCCEDCFGT